MEGRQEKKKNDDDPVAAIWGQSHPKRVPVLCTFDLQRRNRRIKLHVAANSNQLASITSWWSRTRYPHQLPSKSRLPTVPNAKKPTIYFQQHPNSTRICSKMPCRLSHLILVRFLVCFTLHCPAVSAKIIPLCVLRPR